MQYYAVDADMYDAHPWCKSPVTPHPKGTLLDQDLVTVEAIGEQQSAFSCSKKQWRCLCAHCRHKGMDVVSNDIQVGFGI